MPTTTDTSIEATCGSTADTETAGGCPIANSTLPIDQSPITPTVGRDVHQVGRGSADEHYAPEIRPAKITKVHSDGSIVHSEVNLVVWTSEGQFWPASVPYHGGVEDETPPFSPYYRCPITGRAYPGGTWHWPPRI